MSSQPLAGVKTKPSPQTQSRNLWALVKEEQRRLRGISGMIRTHSLHNTVKGWQCTEEGWLQPWAFLRGNIPQHSRKNRSCVKWKRCASLLLVTCDLQKGWSAHCESGYSKETGNVFTLTTRNQPWVSVGADEQSVERQTEGAIRWFHQGHNGGEGPEWLGEGVKTSLWLLTGIEHRAIGLEWVLCSIRPTH